jgi:DNA ligase-1
MTLLADVVAASAEVTGTSSRSRKTAILAGVLRALDREEVAAAVGFLTGAPRQGRIGVGYATVRGL